MSLKIAVIGAGQTSKAVHLPTLKRLSDEGVYELSILCDLNAEVAKAQAESFGFLEWTHDAEAIFSRDDIDAVFVFATAKVQWEYGMRALQNGKHLFVEKPPAPDTQSALSMLALARQKNLVAAVGFNRRFQANIEKVKQTIEASSRIYSMEAFYHKPSLGEPLRFGASSWLGVNAIHAIDLVCYMAGGRPAALYSAKNSIDATPYNFSALLVWENGTQALLSSNNSAGARLETYTFHSLEHSYYCNKASTLKSLGPQENTDETFEDSLENKGFYGEHLEFARAVADGTPIRNDIEVGVVAVRLMELMEQGYAGVIDWSAIFGAQPQAGESLPIPPLSPTPLPRSGKESILILNPNVIKDSLPEIKKKFEIVYWDSLPTMSQEEKQGVVAIINGRGAGGKILTTELLNELPSLRVMGVNYVSLKEKNFNPEELIARGIAIINAKDVYANAVAEFTLMQTLVGLRSALRSHEVMRQGGWGIVSPGSFLTKQVRGLKEKLMPLRPYLLPLWRQVKPAFAVSDIGVVYRARGGKHILHGATVGIIGYGAIARRFIELLQPFECNIKVYSDYLTPEEADLLKVSHVTLAEALNAQVVSLHRGLSDRTRRSFGKAQIDMLKPGSVLVNTSRGEIVDTQALLERLHKGDIFACLDVFDEEPLPPNNPFRKLPNVFLTSHISGSTDTTYKAADQMLAKRVMAYLEGEEKAAIRTLEMLQNMT